MELSFAVRRLFDRVFWTDLMVSKIKPSIVLTNKTQHSTRISGGNHIRRDIFSDHASRAYDTILAYCLFLGL